LLEGVRGSPLLALLHMGGGWRYVGSCLAAGHCLFETPPWRSRSVLLRLFWRRCRRSAGRKPTGGAPATRGGRRLAGAPSVRLLFRFGRVADEGAPCLSRKATHPVARRVWAGSRTANERTAGERTPKGRRSTGKTISSARRTEIFVWQQANKSRTVGPSGWASKPEQNAILFAKSADLSRGGTMHVLCPHEGNVSHPVPNEEPREVASLCMHA